MAEKTVFVSADHGLAVFYFLQSDVVKTLLQAGVRVVVLTEDYSREVIQRRFGQPGMIVEVCGWTGYWHTSEKKIRLHSGGWTSCGAPARRAIPTWR